MSNHRRRLYLGAALAVAAIIGLIALYQTRDRGPIRFDNFEQIRVGMTEAEVEQLLGCKAGDHTTGLVQVQGRSHDGTKVWVDIPPGVIIAPNQWLGDRGAIKVLYDGHGKVKSAEVSRGRPATTNWWSSIESWLGLGR